MSGHVLPALQDQLVDARCAIRDGLPSSYVLECIRKAEALAAALATGEDTYPAVKKVLDG